MSNVQEYKRTCKQCGKVWHSLADRETKLETEKSSANCNMCLMAGTGNASYDSSLQNQRNVQGLQSELSRLRQCPECLSSNYEETLITINPPSR